MNQPVLEARELTKTFASGAEHIAVFSGLSVSLEGGQSLALMGRSGSGKSTLLSLFCGLERPDNGVITLLGERFDYREAGAAGQQEKRWARLRRRRIGVMFQEANLMPALSVLDNVRLRARLAEQPLEHCQIWLERLGIGELAERYPDQVSGGQRQRAALAMVFAMNPDLILADEPTGSLDRRTAEEVTAELFRLQAETGVALILATHDPELADQCQITLDLAHGARTGPAP
ncbi:ABC transporter ATP-binding protein [Marinobacter sp. DUT-1]|uniref:ABC transporter ATP-binding protein n=1 Tax=Marinobacter sp. DUT-1 TaxID=3412037 RepID=UPI003D163ADD